MTPTPIANRVRPSWRRKICVDDHQQMIATLDMA
jgi:hypothetical protein